MPQFLRVVARWVLPGDKWEKLVVIGLLIVISFLTFFNLENSPRTWHDEGGAMSISKTLVEDGVYAVRNSEGYQTFGAVQSVGPTVLLPVALSFKVFGIGLIQGRLVMAIYLILTVAVFYRLGRALFGPVVAVLAVIFLLGSPAARILYFGRQVLGEVPALGFFLGAWLIWFHGARSKQPWMYPVAGLLIGAAMITKSSYLLMGFGSIASLIILDLIYYKQGYFKALIITASVALACVVTWVGWQVAYFGLDTFQENALKLRQLADSTTGFNLGQIGQAYKFLVGRESSHFYFFFGIPALIYASVLSLRRNVKGFVQVALLIFTLLWLGYYFYGVSFLNHIFAPAAITALFVAKLWYDLAGGFRFQLAVFWEEVQKGNPARANLTMASIIVLTLFALYPLQNVMELDVLDQDQSHLALAEYLRQTVDEETVIDTWERELGVLTDHRYHFPDQSLLTRTHAARYRAASQDYTLGADYFQQYQPSYVVVGWYARWSSLYNKEFLEQSGDLITTIGTGERRYEVYKIQPPLEASPEDILSNK